MSRPVLATLLPALLEGCYLNCPIRYQQERTDPVWVSREELLEDCETLCVLERLPPYVVEVEELHGCGPTEDTGLPYPPPEPGDVRIVCVYTASVEEACRGRAHASRLPPEPLPSQGPLRDWLARSVWEETASIGAFRTLARELARHGAPSALVARAKEAALDEVRHARALRGLARLSVPRVRHRSLPQRSLFEIGLENAAEGCVNETYAALVAHHQARSASPALRPLFARIAQDETRHGQWSWDLDAWLRSALPPHERRALQATRRQASLTLLRSVTEPHPRVRALFGAPSAAMGQRLARALVSSLPHTS